MKFTILSALQAQQFVIDTAAASGKVRLDAYLASQMPQTSRARLQASIKEGLVEVNGRLLTKASYVVRPGDVVLCRVLPPPPLEASAEALPLDIVFEDDHVIVVNKSADMVMHPSPGHYTGTMVNALLHHCGLPPLQVDPGDSSTAADRSFDDLSSSTEDEDDPEEDGEGGTTTERKPGGGGGLLGGATTPLAVNASNPVIRPGIVHRLDKGTTGLVVIAKTDVAHASLSSQFKDRTAGRTYQSITLGVPRPAAGRVAANVGRDFRDRKKMAAFEYACTRGKTAASHYEVLEAVAGGRAALVEWKLETGRTHQIRVHAKYLGHPLLGDELYGGAGGSAVSVLGAGKAPRIAVTHSLVKALARPALHAKTLEFDHPTTGQRLQFDSELPEDFAITLEVLRTELA